jgi:hypothetical protein
VRLACAVNFGIKLNVSECRRRLPGLISCADVSQSGMNVFTYYDNFAGRQEPLIPLWKESWRKHGWNPVVLAPENAIRNLNYAAFVKAVSRLPTVNNKKYELACYVRHLAMGMAGGGLLTDYDVMCYGFTPQAMTDIESKHPEEKFICTLHHRGVPCAIYGRRAGFEWLCSQMMNWPPGEHRIEPRGPHLSDMIICQRLKLHRADVCINYPAEGWDKALLVHFSSGQSKGRKKSDLIREVRPP